MSENRRLVSNKIRTPDGTVIQSFHVHDYVTYIDENGKEYMVDGGLEYLRRNVHKDAPYDELSVYDDDDYNIVRNEFRWGTRGKDGKQPLTFVKLSEMSNAHIVSILDKFHTRYDYLFKKELEYRKDNEIVIED